jgi:hypothetical protein
VDAEVLKDLLERLRRLEEQPRVVYVPQPYPVYVPQPHYYPQPYFQQPGFWSLGMQGSGGLTGTQI